MDYLLLIMGTFVQFVVTERIWDTGKLNASIFVNLIEEILLEKINFTHSLKGNAAYF